MHTFENNHVAYRPDKGSRTSEKPLHMFRFAGAALLLRTALGASHAVDLVAEGLKADKDTISSGETAIAGYIPSSNVVPHSKVDLDMAEINTAVGSGDFATALFVYESGGGGKCTDALITANTGFGTPDACIAGKTTDDPVGNSLKSTSIRTLYSFATSSKMGAETWYNIYKNYWTSTGHLTGGAG